MIKNIIFDLGGVVLGRGYHESGHDMPAFSFLQGDRPFPKYWKDFDLGRISQRAVAEAVATQEECSIEEADSLVCVLREMFDEFPLTAELIRELSGKGYKIYVLSNMPAEYYNHMKNMDVFKYVDGTVISSAEGLSKPDPLIFGLLVSRFGLTPSESLFVDDKLSNTMAAEALDFRTYHFADTEKGPDEIRELLNSNQE